MIGLDYSGNPFKNTFLDFVEIFEKARSLNFQTAIHIAETEGEVCLKETNDILNFKPHRLGMLYNNHKKLTVFQFNLYYF